MRPNKVNSIRTNKFLKNLDVLAFKKDDTIFSQGDTANCCYFILTGSVSEFIPAVSLTKPVMEFKAGDFIGAMKLVLDISRTTTVIVTSDEIKLIKITDQSFSNEIQRNLNFLLRVFAHTIQRISQLDSYKSILKNPSLLQMQNRDYEVIQQVFRSTNLDIVNKLHIPRKFQNIFERNFFEEGDENDGVIYLITEGNVSLSLKLNDSSHEFVNLVAGDFFGISGFTHSETRTYTAKVSSVEASAIGFDRLLLLKILKSDPPLFFNVFRYFVTFIAAYESAFVRACS